MVIGFSALVHWVKIAANNVVLFLFSQKTNFDISCILSL